MRRKHGQYAKASVIREPECAGRAVSKGRKHFRSVSLPASDGCQRSTSPAVNIAAGAAFKGVSNENPAGHKRLRCRLAFISLYDTNVDLI